MQQQPCQSWEGTQSTLVAKCCTLPTKQMTCWDWLVSQSNSSATATALCHCPKKSRNALMEQERRDTENIKKFFSRKLATASTMVQPCLLRCMSLVHVLIQHFIWTQFWNHQQLPWESMWSQWKAMFLPAGPCAGVHPSLPMLPTFLTPFHMLEQILSVRRVQKVKACHWKSFSKFEVQTQCVF